MDIYEFFVLLSDFSGFVWVHVLSVVLFVAWLWFVWFEFFSVKR